MNWKNTPERVQDILTKEKFSESDMKCSDKGVIPHLYNLSLALHDRVASTAVTVTEMLKGRNGMDNVFLLYVCGVESRAADGVV